jgi:ribosome biogenesis GTPase
MPETRTGRVLRGDARVYHVELEGGVVQCAPAGKLFEDLGDVKSPVAVSDLVEVGLEGDPPFVLRVLPRRNFLSRVASSHDPREQILFANVDQLFVVESLRKPSFSSNRTDRILTACRWHGIPAHLVLNKGDLDREGDAAAIRATYEAAGVEVHETSATLGEGLDELRERLVDHVSVFYGASGVGKSTLLNALQPGLGLKVGKISKYWQAGKHTTSYSQMHPLDSGGWVIDTPGIRVFRLHGVTKGELRTLFPEFEPFASRCRFPDCTHDHEPDCAVFEAVEAGKIAPTRYASYVEMLDEAEPPPEDDEVVDPETGAG